MNKLILVTVLFFVMLSFTTACSIPLFGNNNLSKEQIVSLVTENEKLFFDVVREIENFDGDLELVSTTQRSKLYSSSDVGVTGLFIIADIDFSTQERSSPKSIENAVFQNLMDLNKAIEVSVSRLSDAADSSSILIEYSCGGRGFGSNTSYYGFYYSEDDNMTAIWCCGSESELMQEGNGWIHRESDGDNIYYTERIIGHFYYYEAHF